MEQIKGQSPKLISDEDVKMEYKKAQNYSKDYDLSQALICYSAVLQYKSAPTMSNPDTSLQQLQFDACLNICDIYIRKGDWINADKYCRKAKAQAEQMQENIKIARCLDRQGDIKKLMSNLSGALKDYMDSYKLKKYYIGNDNFKLDISNSFNNIGLVYYHQGKFKEALIATRKSLSLRLKILDKDHVDVAMSYNNLGLIYGSLKKPKTALYWYNKSLNIRRNILNQDHPSIATSYNNIGTVYKEQENYTEAREMYTKALDIQILKFGEKHADVATTYSNIGSVCNDLDEYNKAYEMFEKSLKIDLQVFSPNHPNVAKTYSNIGSVYFNTGEHNMALQNYQMAIEILNKGEHGALPDVAVLHSNTATVFFKLSNYEQSLQEYLQAIEITQRIYGDVYPDLIELYKLAAQCYKMMNFRDEAITMQQKSNDIRNYRRFNLISGISSNQPENRQGNPVDTSSNIL